MAEHFTKLGKNLGGAVQSYNLAMGSFEHRVLVSARKFKELGSVSSAAEIAPLDPSRPYPTRTPSSRFK